MNFVEWIKETVLLLEHAGISDAKSELYQWLTMTTGKDRAFFITHNREPMRTVLSPDEYLRLEEIRSRRILREPLSYITGQAYFWERSFSVGPGVLIPRQDSEVVLEAALAVLGIRKEMSRNISLCIEPGKTLHLMDLCTGSGCLGISLLEELYQHHVTTDAILTDISTDAMEYARENIKNSSCKEHLHLVHCDLFPDEDQFLDIWNKDKCDLLLSNPPYITSDEMTLLMPEVGKHEPWIALNGGKDGLFFYREILRNCDKYLRADGVVIFEHGYDQGDSVPALCREFGFTEVYCLKDHGGNPRVTVAGNRR